MTTLRVCDAHLITAPELLLRELNRNDLLSHARGFFGNVTQGVEKMMCHLVSTAMRQIALQTSDGKTFAFTEDDAELLSREAYLLGMLKSDRF